MFRGRASAQSEKVERACVHVKLGTNKPVRPVKRDFEGSAKQADGASGAGASKVDDAAGMDRLWIEVKTSREGASERSGVATFGMQIQKGIEKSC